MASILLLVVSPVICFASISYNDTNYQDSINDVPCTRTTLLGDNPSYPATSCQQVFDWRPTAESGHYWIQNECCPKRIYCVRNKTECGSGVWTEVANIDMSIPSTTCPSGFVTSIGPKSCRKYANSACSSAIFPTFGQSFHKVCGKIIGYQKSTHDAFHIYNNDLSITANDTYVDGISVIYNEYREHIWTFAAQLDVSKKTNI